MLMQGLANFKLKMFLSRKLFSGFFVSILKQRYKIQLA